MCVGGVDDHVMSCHVTISFIGDESLDESSPSIEPVSIIGRLDVLKNVPFSTVQHRLAPVVDESSWIRVSHHINDVIVE